MCKESITFPSPPHVVQPWAVPNKIVGRERRVRVSQLAWCGEGCFDSRRRVNSTVRLHQAPIREALMKFSVGLIMLLLLGVAVHAQSKAAGAICIAPPDRPTSGEKSLANPAGGNPISTYSIQVDKMSPVVASNDRSIRISSIATSRKHLVKIIGDGKVVQSFWFNF